MAHRRACLFTVASHQKKHTIISSRRLGFVLSPIRDGEPAKLHRASRPPQTLGPCCRAPADTPQASTAHQKEEDEVTKPVLGLCSSVSFLLKGSRLHALAAGTAGEGDRGGHALGPRAVEFFWGIFREP